MVLTRSMAARERVQEPEQHAEFSEPAVKRFKTDDCQKLMDVDVPKNQSEYLDSDSDPEVHDSDYDALESEEEPETEKIAEYEVILTRKQKPKPKSQENKDLFNLVMFLSGDELPENPGYDLREDYLDFEFTEVPRVSIPHTNLIICSREEEEYWNTFPRKQWPQKILLYVVEQEMKWIHDRLLHSVSEEAMYYLLKIEAPYEMFRRFHIDDLVCNYWDEFAYRGLILEILDRMEAMRKPACRNLKKEWKKMQDLAPLNAMKRKKEEEDDEEDEYIDVVTIDD